MDLRYINVHEISHISVEDAEGAFGDQETRPPQGMDRRVALSVQVTLKNLDSLGVAVAAGVTAGRGLKP